MVDAGGWIPFKFGRGMGPKLSHMSFVDDLILVTVASSHQVNVMRDILQDFCNASGKKINMQKYHVCFFENVGEQVA